MQRVGEEMMAARGTAGCLQGPDFLHEAPSLKMAFSQGRREYKKGERKFLPALEISQPTVSSQVLAELFLWSFRQTERTSLVVWAGHWDCRKVQSLS